VNNIEDYFEEAEYTKPRFQEFAGDDELGSRYKPAPSVSPQVASYLFGDKTLDWELYCKLKDIWKTLN
jgi:hypothetical protein